MDACAWEQSADSWGSSSHLVLDSDGHALTHAFCLQHGSPDAWPTLQKQSAAPLLRSLRGLGVLQEPHSRPQRYSMHPLIRQVAADMREQQVGSEHDPVVGAFVGACLRVGKQLSSLHQTASEGAAGDTAAAARLLRLETPNFQSLLRLLAPDHEPRFLAMLEQVGDAQV